MPHHPDDAPHPGCPVPDSPAGPPALWRAEGLHAPAWRLGGPWMLRAGLNLVCGDEGRGKTAVLRWLAQQPSPVGGALVWCGPGAEPSGPRAAWLDPSAGAGDPRPARAVLDGLAARWPGFDAALLADLLDALDLAPHLHKGLHMLSTGTRRKLWSAAALAAGKPITLLDQPFAALDHASIGVLLEVLTDAAGHTGRAWVIADYAPPPDLPLASVLDLDGPATR